MSKPLPLSRGFTLIELLVVFAILGILSVIGIGNFQNTRLKARDANRKSDLATISKALETYANDYRRYPGSQGGEIICTPPTTTCAWDTPFIDDKDTLYIARLPKDPVANFTYRYESNGTTFTLFAYLENTQDPAIEVITPPVSCGSVDCNYQLKSSNQL